MASTDKCYMLLRLLDGEGFLSAVNSRPPESADRGSMRVTFPKPWGSSFCRRRWVCVAL